MKVLLGMSGGVDSSVAAYLLQKQGYEVVGLHFSIDGKPHDLTDVDCVCKTLGITYFTVDFSEAFQSKVFKPFLNAYESGKTPNICVACNKYIKFGLMFDKAQELGCDFVATGHYCKKIVKNGISYLAKPKDRLKDQTYFLNGISQSALSKTLFPLGELTKDEVRAIAAENGLLTAYKKGSSDVCLAGDRKFADFISDYLSERSGKIYGLDGKVVGNHRGIQFYTLGQRKGLNLGGKSGEDGRWFVVKKDGAKNALYVAHGSEDLLMSYKLKISDCNFISDTPAEKFSCMAKTRYRSELYKADVTIEKNCATVEFSMPVRAITVGQYCVFYDGDICLGGGEITDVSLPFEIG